MKIDLLGARKKLYTFLIKLKILGQRFKGNKSLEI